MFAVCGRAYAAVEVSGRWGMSTAEAKVRMNVYRRGTVWRYTTWVDGYHFRTGLLPVVDDAPEAVAIEAARAMYTDPVTVTRVADLPFDDIAGLRKPAKRRDPRATTAVRSISTIGDPES